MKPAPVMVTAPTQPRMSTAVEVHSTPTVAQPPTCLGCGKRLHLGPHAFGSPSIDAMNWFSGVAYCQACLLRGDAA